MRLLFLSIFLLPIICCTAQDNVTAKKIAVPLNEKTVVKDSSGILYTYATWKNLVATGHYILKPEDARNTNTAYILTRLTDEEYAKKMATIPKPRESDYFKTGAAFSYFKAKDINGNKINEKTLAGKILVLNYWFINCPPCRMEIPELNKLKEQYKDDTSVVFVAVGLDDKYSIKQFLRSNPFQYQIIDDGRFIARDYNIGGYPTNVIVDHEGKIYFHTSGFGNNLMPWLTKSIGELKSAMEKKGSSSASTGLQ
jgi:thiol-disulfide isomerase/thioredoxin